MSDEIDRIRRWRDDTPGRKCTLRENLHWHDVDALLNEVDRFREHSVLLNRVSWRISEALGDIPEGADSVESEGVLVDLDRLLAENERLRGIVSALAAVEPWRFDDSGDPWCALCGTLYPDTEPHAFDCPWRLARELQHGDTT